ncbi:MAG: LptE family protein [Syntrophaceae bacterium]|nr:LptE family protein [Syntrophaceae bacterium]
MNAAFHGLFNRICKRGLQRSILLILMICLFAGGCGYKFGEVSKPAVFPANAKTILIESAVNNTVITGVETELTNELRREFALDPNLKPTVDNGDVNLKTVISFYDDTPSAYRADGKELTRSGTLRVRCSLIQSGTLKQLWKNDFSASYTYTVTDSIQGTLSNRRRAISQMIRDITPRIHRSIYDSF